MKIRALNDDIIISNMYFGEQKTASGIILRNDDGKTHGIKPRWGKIFEIGPDQKEFKIGQWVLIEHGRWSRKFKFVQNDQEIEIQKIDVNGILAVSDEEPSAEDIYISDSI